MQEHLKFYIDGQWLQPSSLETHAVINPATEQPVAIIALGSAADVDLAVTAARKAFDSYSHWTVEARAGLLERIIAIYQRRSDEIAAAITQEMGAPSWLAQAAHVYSGLVHFQAALEALRGYEFFGKAGSTAINREPIGVCGLITPWNWPQNQIVCKVAPALAAGCTVILKPSELAPLDAMILAEILEEAGVPPGVFNLVNGNGDGVGKVMAGHPGIDMISFTGSTRAGTSVSQEAAVTIKRVTLELGGKSANILLDDVNLEPAVAEGVSWLMINSGQNCNAPSRMLVPEKYYADAIAIASSTAESIEVMKPEECVAGTIEEQVTAGAIGPLANAAQYAKVRQMIDTGTAEGARLVSGGAERPEDMECGYYLRPTIFADVDNSMTIAQEEIFGPVLCIMPYSSEEEAVEIANDSKYGLAGYVQSGSLSRAQEIAMKLRTGMVHLNGAHEDPVAGAFGGYKQSGNGREFGAFGLEEFMEVKSVFGWRSN